MPFPGRTRQLAPAIALDLVYVETETTLGTTPNYASTRFR